MYAVIRSGGKQYRVVPGDVVRVEKLEIDSPEGGHEFACEVLAVSAGDGVISKAGDDARVVGELVEEGRGKKILVFHYKRKKQYKRLRGHRQPFTSMRITEIGFGGTSVKAPALPAKKVKPEVAATAASQKTRASVRAQAVKAAPTKAAAKKKAAKKAAYTAKKLAG